MTTERTNAIKWIAATVVLLGLGAGGGYWWAHYRMSSNGSVAAPSSSAEPANTSGASGKRRILYWHDPMVPGQKFDKPGKSPYMNMELVPVYADEEGNGAAVRVRSNVTQNLGMRLGKVEKTILRPRVSAVGSVAFDERLLELVQARVEGYVTTLYVKSPLEHVRRGQPLADILSPQWRAAQEEYLALLAAQSERGQSIRDAARQRLTVLGVPEETIAALDRDRKPHATTTIFAPSDGVVTELAVREGAAFMPGAPLFRINGLKTVWVNAQVPEAQVSMIPMGASVTARATAWTGESFKGRVIALLPDVDPQTRTLSVRIALDNPGRKLAPGMFVSLEFIGPAGVPQLAVPSEAVIMTGERNAVIVARESGGFDVTDVTVGAEVNGKTAILSGLTEGQPIVLSGQFLIDSEASLRSTVSRLSAGAASESAGATLAEPVVAAHLTQGRITAIDADTITIAHDSVPSLRWPPMTMAFKRPSTGLPAGLKVGDRVSFSFTEAGPGTYQIASLTMLDEANAPGDTGTEAHPGERHP
jgi:Cu(I)/Ag(I) efflux system membrane fusion protein